MPGEHMHECTRATSMHVRHLCMCIHGNNMDACSRDDGGGAKSNSTPPWHQFHPALLASNAGTQILPRPPATSSAPHPSTAVAS